MVGRVRVRIVPIVGVSPLLRRLVPGRGLGFGLGLALGLARLAAACSETPSDIPPCVLDPCVVDAGDADGDAPSAPADATDATSE
jgi:hypothetical protein